LVPGLLMALAYGIVVSITARRRGYRPERERPAPVRDIARTGVATIWAIMFPILLIVTLRSGLLVPSEAGAVACLYAVLVGLLAYRELDWERFKQAAQSSILDTGMIMLLIAMRSEEHTSELQSRENLVCRLLLEKKKNRRIQSTKYL